MLAECRPMMPWRLGPILLTPASGEWHSAHFLKTSLPAAASPSAQAVPIVKVAAIATRYPIQRIVIPHSWVRSMKIIARQALEGEAPAGLRQEAIRRRPS